MYLSGFIQPMTMINIHWQLPVGPNCDANEVD